MNRSTSTAPRGAVIFDLDGTLVDSVQEMLAEINKILLDRGVQPLSRDEAAGFLGDGMHRFAQRACAARGIVESTREVRRFVSEYGMSYHDQTHLFPDVQTTLQTLHNDGWRMSVCTNKVDAVALDILRVTGIDHYFDVVCGSGSAPSLKPDPRHLQTVVERANYRGLRLAMVGDHRNDHDAAAGYGMPYFYAGWGYGQLPDTADAVRLGHFAELPAALDRLG